MVQAVRFGVQNIADGPAVAATSAKFELNLYNVARAALEELKLDYQDCLGSMEKKSGRKMSFFMWDVSNAA